MNSEKKDEVEGQGPTCTSATCGECKYPSYFSMHFICGGCLSQIKLYML